MIKRKKKIVKKKSVKKKSVKKAKKKYEHHPDHYNTSESFLVNDLPEDLKDAWMKVREFGASLGEQRIYASGRAIMFSRRVCYFFVRPKKTFLETVVFLKNERSLEDFKSIKAVSKTKFAYTYRLIHPDQVEGELTDAITAAYAEGV